MGKSRISGTNMAFIRYVLVKEAIFHINFTCFNRNFDHPHVTAVTFVPRKPVQKPQFFPTKHSFY